MAIFSHLTAWLSGEERRGPGEPGARRHDDKAGSLAAYWSLPAERLLAELRSSAGGLSQAEAERRLLRYGANAIQAGDRSKGWHLLLSQFRSPLVLILIFAAVVSALVGEWPDAVIVLAVVVGSSLLGFVQEYRACDAIEKLRSRILIRSIAFRDGQPRELPSRELAPGDVVELSAGSLIPADGIVLEANDLFVNQAVLTGEVYPVEKRPGLVASDASLMDRLNCVFMGTSVRSGTARVLIVRTAKATVIGQIADRLSLQPAETEFERGVHRFGYLLTRVLMVMVIGLTALYVLAAELAKKYFHARAENARFFAWPRV